MSQSEWQKIGQSSHQSAQQIQSQQQQLDQQRMQLDQQRMQLEQQKMQREQQKESQGKVGDRWMGRVERVVPGMLVYVEFTGGQEAKVFKLNNLLIKQANGTFSNYTGESLSQLGLTVGSSVEVVTTKGPQQANVVFDPRAQSSKISKARGFFRSG